MKNRLFTAFNIIGFSVALAVCIIIALFVYRENSVDTFYRNAGNVYRLVDIKNRSVEMDHTVAAALKEQYPQIEEAVPMYYYNAGEFSMFLKHSSTHNAIRLKGVASTTNGFFKMANLKILEAKNVEPLADVNSVVLSRSAAMSLFGKTNVLGEIVTCENCNFTVSAVVEDMPANSSLKPDIYINTETPDYRIGQTCSENGCFLRRNILLSLIPGTDVNALAKKISSPFPENKSGTRQVSLQPLLSVYLNPIYDGSPNETGNRKIILIILTIGVLTLLMSVFNYLNFSISKQLSTLKDSGVRITNGVGIGQLKWYYITEAGLTIFISMLIALLISWLVLPFSETLFNEKLSFCWLLNPRLFLPLLGVVAFIIVMASMASVTFISRLTPQALFNRTAVHIGGYSVRRLLTIAQLVISLVLLTCLMFISRQLTYVKTANVGFNKDLLLRVDIPWTFKNYEMLKSAYASLPFVKNICLTSHTPGAGWSINGVETQSGKSLNVNTVNVDKNFFKTFELKLLSGRNLLESDINNACCVTQTTVKQMEWDNIEGKNFNGSQVIGVVNDINMNSLHTSIVPVVFLFSNNYYSALNLRLIPGNTALQIKQIQKLWNKLLPDEPMTFGFYDDYYCSLYQKEDRQAQTIMVFLVVVVIITCLGLLGQIMQTTERRIKEIGIRKINGAGISELITMLIREYVFSALVAFVLAVPIAWYAMHNWLERFVYKIPLSWWIFAIACVLTLVIALLTVSGQSWRAATRNPVEALRYE